MPLAHSLSTLLSAWRAAVTETNHPQPPAYSGPDVALTGFTEKTGEVAPGMALPRRGNVAAWLPAVANQGIVRL